MEQTRKWKIGGLFHKKDVKLIFFWGGVEAFVFHIFCTY